MTHSQQQTQPECQSTSGTVTKCLKPPEPDDLWSRVLREALVKLPPKDAAWLADRNNQAPFTSMKLAESVHLFRERYSERRSQKFLARVDPIVSHIRSFTSAINTLANADPTGAGVVWGSVHLVLIVAGRTQRHLEQIVDFLDDLSPQLNLFRRWRLLFPEKPFTEVSDAIKNVYIEIIAFCTCAVRFLRRHPITNFLRAIICPTFEEKLRRHVTSLHRYTARVRDEVETAHMEVVQGKLEIITSFIDGAPTPAYLELPTIRIIPHLRNERFFGRQTILDQMRNKLLPCRRASARQAQKQQRFALSGLGGSGKTQIALEFTYRHLKEYKVVVWVLADNVEKINQGFGETAELFGLRKGTQSASQVRSFVLQRLSASNEPYLLCFDNADDLSLIQEWLPRDDKGTILVTSRDSVGTRDVIGDGEIVPEFTVTEGRDFLASLLGTDGSVSTEKRATLERISSTFHGYPLALAQAGAFISSGGCTLSRFLEIFQDEQSSNMIASIPLHGYHANLFTVLNLSFHSLTPHSQQILEILVYLDPDSIPCELFEEGCIPGSNVTPNPELSHLSDAFKLWEALKGLRSQSLIRTNDELHTISIHRFLQHQAFKRLCNDPYRRRKAFEESLFLLSNYQPEFPNVTQHWSPDLFKNSEVCLAHIKQLAVRFWENPEVFHGLENRLGRLIFESASYQFERFHHHAAANTFSLARRVIEKASIPNELYLSDCYRMEGRMLNESGQAIQGAESNRQARNYAFKANLKGYIGDSDQRMPRILTGLGNSLSQLNRFDEALDCQLQAKRLCGDVPPEQSDAITIIQLNLGFLLYRRGELSLAEKVLRATLDASPRTPPAMYALGNTLLAQGKVEEAIATHMKGLEIYIQMFGDEHALVGRCVYKVGEILLLHKKDSRTARTYINKAIKIYLKQESTYYTEKAYARAIRMLAKAFDFEGRKGDAQVYYEQAWNLRERIDGVHGSLMDTDEDYTKVMFYWDQ